MYKKLSLLWDVMKGYRTLYVGAIAAIGFAALFSLTGPLVLRFTIDSVIGNQPPNAPAWIMSFIAKLGGTSVLAQNLWLCGFAFVALGAANCMFLYYRGRWSAVASEAMAKGFRTRMYDRLQRMPYDALVKAETGDLVQRCTSDIDTVRKFLASQFVEIGRAIFMLVITAGFMIALDPGLTLVAMAVIPIIFAFAVVFFMKVQAAFQKSDEAEGRLSTVLQENLTGVRVVRAFAREKYEIEKLDIKNREYRDLTYKLIRILAFYWSASDFLCMLQIGAVLVVGSYRCITAPTVMTVGTLVAFLLFEARLLWPVRQMGRILADLGKTMVSLGRIREVLEKPIETVESTLVTPAISGGIEFRNVTFGYAPDKPVLKNISFKAHPGETIAILGPTGSGKSSLVHLLPRLYEYEGSIIIDGVELNTIDKTHVRKNIGIVLQEPFLFSKTLFDNIALAEPGAAKEDVESASSTAAVHDVILSFEKGYETAVGERGVTLSGGQKQRVAIARTLVGKPSVVIFDDSLSAVDTETDAAIRKALRERRDRATTFIISHRITTLAEADRILVLENGVLTQCGTHEELIEQEGLYRRVWHIQNELEEELSEEIDSAPNGAAAHAV